MIKTIKEIIEKLLVVLLLTLVASLTQIDRLPTKDLIQPSLFNEPQQLPTSQKPFKTTVNNETYQVTPVADYELYGLVVSLHHSSSWIDSMHERSKDYLNLADFCVIYGGNISSGAYRHLNFGHTDWQCTVQWSAQDYEKYNLDQNYNNRFLSNNHVLSDNPDLIKKILSVRNGDQVYMKGHLVNYKNQRFEAGSRNTSLTRDDSGDGACEIMYVTDFKVLQMGNISWRFLYKVVQEILIGLLLIYILVSYLHARNIFKETLKYAIKED